jgi:predicted nucleic acid-binding protein
LRVFADTVYFGALLVPNDNLHDVAVGVAGRSGGDTFVTTDAVLTELLAYVAKRGAHARAEAVGLVDDMQLDSAWTLVRQTGELWDRAFELYRQRMDKGYSLTDCISMVVCRDLGVAEVLSHDHHFEQEGFAILL